MVKVLVALVLAAIGLGAWLGARQVYFLGTDEGGRLTLYRGLPYDLPFGVELYSEVYSIPVQVSSLPEDRRDAAINHELRGRDDAVSLLDSLEADAAVPTPTPQEPPAVRAVAGATSQRPGGRGGTAGNVGQRNEPRDGGNGAGDGSGQAPGG